MREMLAFRPILGSPVIRSVGASSHGCDFSWRFMSGPIFSESGQVAMVAAHNSDLAAAQAVGLRTAFVHRPTEHGPNQTTDLRPEGDWDVVVDDFEDLASKLG